jgi:hypothetical protein
MTRGLWKGEPTLKLIEFIQKFPTATGTTVKNGSDFFKNSSITATQITSKLGTKEMKEIREEFKSKLGISTEISEESRKELEELESFLPPGQTFKKDLRELIIRHLGSSTPSKTPIKSIETEMTLEPSIKKKKFEFTETNQFEKIYFSYRERNELIIQIPVSESVVEVDINIEKESKMLFKTFRYELPNHLISYEHPKENYICDTSKIQLPKDVLLSKDSYSILREKNYIKISILVENEKFINVNMVKK